MTERGKRPELGKLEPGQKVMVRRSANDMRHRPPEDRYIPAVVVKAARVWVVISAEQKIIEWRMRKDTQDEGTAYSGSNASFVTLEQYEWDETWRWALGVLTENGIRLERGSTWEGREVDLADLITGGTRVKLVAEIRYEADDTGISPGMGEWLHSVADRIEQAL